MKVKKSERNLVMVTKSVVTNKTNGLKRQQHDLGAVFNINSCVIPDSEPKMQSLTQINGQGTVHI